MVNFETALIFHRQGDYLNAVLNYGLALSENPNDFNVLSNLGAALQKLRRFEDALNCYSRAIEITKEYASIYNNRGVTLQELHLLNGAINDFDRAIDLNPRYTEALVNRGFTKHLANDFDAAISDYKQAIEVEPNFPAAHFNLSLCQLAIGDYAQGWRNYEWRWKAATEMCIRIFPDQQPLWQGESLQDKTILIYSEQGLGDTIQFCRYITLVKDLGARVILEAPKELLGLLTKLEGVDSLIDNVNDAGAFDFQCPMMSLPNVFKTEISTIPKADSYLTANAVRSEHWRIRLREHKRLRVGLVWSGGFRPDQPKMWGLNNRRNLPFAYLQSFQSVDADLFSLQKGEPAESEFINALKADWCGPVIHPYGQEFQDFADTAAFIENLDLVISVDTSTAHLAGALGKPVWILNRFDSCWRWLIARDDSPWYNSARLYKQTQAGDWDSVITRVVTDLNHKIETSKLGC